MRLFKNANYRFLGLRRRAYLVSVALIAVGFLVLAVRGGYQFGVDFTGGTRIHVSFSQPTDAAAIRAALQTGSVEGAELQAFGGDGDYVIRVGSLTVESGEEALAVVGSALDAAFGAEAWNIEDSDAVGPKVGAELRTRALLAVLASFVLTLVYLAFRFEWRFGIAAVVATIHDILVTFGFLAVFNIEVTLATVAAILTIIGYSLNDTIVVFDRVRENLKKRRKETYTSVLDSSINETLPRTVLTSASTLVTLTALFVLGGAVIRPFAGVLILGVLIGTYSSIFVASPVLQEIEDYTYRKEHGRSAGG
ncbi:MAG: protein translocase subunit SecF [Gemmatimonadota bacterium]